jgi:hypothetical protein
MNGAFGAPMVVPLNASQCLQASFDLLHAVVVMATSVFNQTVPAQHWTMKAN